MNGSISNNGQRFSGFPRVVDSGTGAPGLSIPKSQDMIRHVYDLAVAHVEVSGMIFDGFVSFMFRQDDGNRDIVCFGVCNS